MTTRSTGQSWALDIALAQGGFDALHPGAKGTLEQLGHDHTDFDKVFDLVRSGAMLPKAWATVAGQAEERGAHHERNGFAQTAADLYVRAAVMWGRAQYSVFDAADPRKAAFRKHANHCVERLGTLRGGRVRRVVLDFEGKQIYGLLHLPPGEVREAPAVILGPGMDMIKEDYRPPPRGPGRLRGRDRRLRHHLRAGPADLQEQLHVHVRLQRRGGLRPRTGRAVAAGRPGVYENEFHPLGGVAAEVFRFGAEWVERALNGEFAEAGRDVRHYVHRDGRTTDGTANPTWWLGARVVESRRIESS
jgi:hypothetical protein